MIGEKPTTWSSKKTLKTVLNYIERSFKALISSFLLLKSRKILVPHRFLRNNVDFHSCTILDIVKLVCTINICTESGSRTRTTITDQGILSPLRLPNFAISAYLYYISSEASQITIIKKVVKNPAQIVNGINIKLPKQEAGKHRNRKTKAPVRHIFDQWLIKYMIIIIKKN